MCKELGRLAQGCKDLTHGTNTVHFMNVSDIPRIPKDRTVTHARIVADHRPQKEDPNRIRVTVGGNLTNFPGDVSTHTADLTTTKLLWNSVLSTPNARHMCADIKNFYLETPMDRHEHMRIPIDLIPQEFIDECDLEAKTHKGHIYLETCKGVCGLPQAGRTANDLLRK